MYQVCQCKICQEDSFKTCGDKPDITLIFPDSPFLEAKTMFPPLGIMYISSYLKHFGQTVQCLDMALGHKPEDAESDLIGISFTTPQREPAFELIRHFKREGNTVVVGGPHPTHMEQECINAGADKVFKGHGEHDLLEWMVGTKVSRLSIDDIPYPDRDCLPIHEYVQFINDLPATAIMAARGCPFNCSFCSQVDKRYLPQSSEKTIAEIRFVREKYEFRGLTLYDDCFLIDKQRLFDISEALKHEDMRFRCFARTSSVTDEKAEMLAKMGTVAVGLGVESGSEEILKINMKGTTRKKNTEAIKSLQKVGIEAKAFLIVGLPGESPDTVRETLSWIEEARPDAVGVSVFQPLPGSAIFNNPSKWGIDFNYDGQPLVYRGKRGEYVSNTSTPQMTSKQVIECHTMIEDFHKEFIQDVESVHFKDTSRGKEHKPA